MTKRTHEDLKVYRKGYPHDPGTIVRVRINLPFRSLAWCTVEVRFASGCVVSLYDHEVVTDDPNREDFKARLVRLANLNDDLEPYPCYWQEIEL